MFGFETLLQQVVTNGTTVVSTPPAVQQATIESFQAMIVAVASIIGTAGAVLHTLSQRGQQNEQKKALGAAADVMKDFSGHMIQSKEDIKSLAEVTYNMLPDQAQKIVNQQNVRLAELTKKLEAAQTQLSKLPPVLDHI